MKLVWKIVTIAVAVAFFAGAAVVQPVINFIRTAEELTFEPPTEGVPPILVFTTTAMGAFRGLVVDVLWLRLSKLMEESKYYEMMQLADWICKLEPRFPPVWAWQAWNMAYNISVDLPTAPERWRWVMAGISLLRDQGLHYNPNSALIYKELSWTFFHKVGQESDDHHWYYKKMMLKEMEAILGEGPDAPNLPLIAESPEKLRELVKDLEVRELVNELRAAGMTSDRHSRMPDEARRIIEKHIRSEAGSKVHAFFSARTLRDEWKMDPRFMQKLMEEWGPIDWRLPVAHSLYWATRGRMLATEADDTIHYDRLIYFSIQDMVRKGTIKIVKPRDGSGDGLYLTSPDYRFLEAMERAFITYMMHYEGTPYGSTIRDAYQVFLERSIWTCYFRGEMKKAAQFYRKRYPDQPISRKLLHEHVEKEIRNTIRDTTHHAVIRMLELMVANMWWHYASMDDDNAVHLLKQSEQIYEIYKSERVKSDKPERLALATFTELKNDVLNRIVSGNFPGLPFPRILVENLEERVRREKREGADNAADRP